MLRRLLSHARDAAVGATMRGASKHPRPNPGQHVTIAGLLTSPSGLGEGARLFVQSFAELGWDVGLRDLTRFMRLPGGVDFPMLAAHGEHDSSHAMIWHLNPPDLQRVMFRLGWPARNRTTIAHWTWELPVIPRIWHQAFRLLHEVWVPSGFVRNALANAQCPVPIRIVPYPVHRPEIPEQPSHDTAADRPLTVLTVFAYDSGFTRKNPLAAIAAFRQAFGNRSDVRLLVKLRGASSSGRPESEVAACVASANNIHLISGTMSRTDYWALVASCDIYLSLHRSEGFGIPLAEAMLLGKPVVATGWSGNLEFMTADTAALVSYRMISAEDESDAYRGLSAEWAEPDIEHAADWLRRLEDPVLREHLGSAGRAHAAARLSVAAFERAILGCPLIATGDR